jgi:hypothetical protein
VLWHRTGDFSRATRRAGRAGRAIGQAMIVSGVLLFVYGGLGALWLALIGWFIVRSADAETELAELEMQRLAATSARARAGARSGYPPAPAGGSSRIRVPCAGKCSVSCSSSQRTR